MEAWIRVSHRGSDPRQGSATAAALVVRRFLAHDAAAEREFASLRRLEGLLRGVAVEDADGIGRAAGWARARWGIGCHDGRGPR